MANARALDKRRKSIRNIKKITRTMELIATARFKKAMDRATAASAYTQRITELVADLTQGGNHGLIEQFDHVGVSVDGILDNVHDLVALGKNDRIP